MYRVFVGACFAIAGAAALLACAPETEADKKAQYDSIQSAAQRSFDRGVVVCKDGYAYLAGYVDRSMWVTPYLRNGVQGKCTDKNANWNSSDKE